jgi:hypothetical protein
MGHLPSKGQIYCPSMNSPAGYPRAFRTNQNMAGGATSDTYPAGPYGKVVEVYWYPDSRVYTMHIGAPLSMARRQAKPFLAGRAGRLNPAGC